MQKNIKAIVLIIFLLLFIAIFSFFLNIKINDVREVSYQKGWNDAKARLYAQIGSIANDGIVRDMVFGTITKINGNQINIKISSSELLSDPALDNRIVTVNNQTQIYKFQPKSKEEYKKELENYYKENNIDINTFVPSPDRQLGPDKYEQVLTNLENLKVGQVVNVYANQNIKEIKNFIAKEIVIKK
ncbi:hypothetical protein KAI65_05655 [Candidatus Parcubacteria bacterium]|nr:hypothetical protein [Candidatus Parcubacteria bacterium]